MDEQITQMDDMAGMIEGLNTEEVYLFPFFIKIPPEFI